MIPIWTISLRFFSPPEKPTFTGRLSISVHVERVRLLARELEELAARQRLLAAARALGVERLAQELDVGHAGNLDRILEAEEQPAAARSCGASSSRSCAVEASPSPPVTS